MDAPSAKEASASPTPQPARALLLLLSVEEPDDETATGTWLSLTGSGGGKMRARGAAAAAPVLLDLKFLTLAWNFCPGRFNRAHKKYHVLPANDAGWHREGHGALGTVAVALLTARAVLTLGAGVRAHVSPLDEERCEKKETRMNIISPSKLS